MAIYELLTLSKLSCSKRKLKGVSPLDQGNKVGTRASESRSNLVDLDICIDVIRLEDTDYTREELSVSKRM